MTTLMSPFPVNDPIAQPRRPQYEKGGAKYGQKDPFEGLVPKSWNEAFTQFQVAVSNNFLRLNSIPFEAQAASLAPTDLSLGGQGAGYYLVQTYARVTQAATTSSALTVTVGWTESGQNLTASDTNLMNTNTITTVGSFVWLVLADQSTPVTISTTYASVGGTPMLYRLTAVLTRVNA